MDIPWGQAVLVGVTGFGMVFMLLIILGVLIWLTGWITGSTRTSETEATPGKKKGE